MKENVFIRSDKETIAGLKKIAHGKPVAKFLRDVAAGSPPPTCITYGIGDYPSNCP